MNELFRSYILSLIVNELNVYKPQLRRLRLGVILKADEGGEWPPVHKTRQ